MTKYKSMNPFFIPIYQLYLLQLENYELGRYWALLFQKGYFFSPIPLRKSIVWTPKAMGIFVCAFLLYMGIAGAVFLFLSIVPAFCFLIFGFLLFPVFYSVTTMCLLPVDWAAKQFFIAKAKSMLVSSPNVIVIGIAGSYGKTTMKNVLSKILSVKFNTITTPESVNTPIGIAQWICKAFTKQTEIVLVEMGEHYKGDIAYLCSIAPPDIAVLTGINEAHLERLMSIDISVATLFEIVQNAKSNALIVLNADDKRIRKFYSLFTHGKTVSFYSSFKNSSEKQNVIHKKFDEKKLQWTFELSSFGMIKVPLLGEYAIGDVIAAITVGKSLKMTNDELKKGIALLTPIPHRLEPIKGAGGTIVIDDSYNGNPDGVKEAICVLSRFTLRRKVFITPGLVETGKDAKSIHVQIGRDLAPVADRVVLIRNSVTPFIEQGLKEQKFDETHIIWFNTATEAHEALSGIVQANDVVLFQNDWGDQYV